MDTTTDSRIELRPTFVIGLGGTGHEVVARLKARYLDTFGPETFKIIRLLAFDTADEPGVVSNQRGEEVRLDKGTELINIGHVPVPNIVKNLDRQPAVGAWLPKDLPPRAVTAGAQMIRAMGRLALFHHFNSVQKRIQQEIRSLQNIRNQSVPVGNFGIISRSSGINAIIVASACGGTGSGTFIDMAYLLRHFCTQNGIPEEDLFVTGVLVLPQAFATVPGDAIKANAYATLLELDHFSESGSFCVEYPGNVQLDFQVRRPFNICYLVDAVNERGKMLSGIPELAPMLAESIFLQTASQIGDAQKSVFDNVKALDGVSDDDHLTCFSGIGTASLVFPAQLVIDACASRFLVDLLAKGLLTRAPTPALVEEEVGNSVDRLQLTPDYLVTALSRDAQARPIRVRLDGAVLDKVADADMYRKTEQLVQTYDDQRMKDLFQKYTDANYSALLGDLSREMDADILRLMNDPARGPQFALAFIDGVITVLREVQKTLTAERTHVEDALASSAKAVDDARVVLSKSLTTGLPINRRGRIVRDRDRYLQLQQNRFTQQLEVRLRTLAISALAEVTILLNKRKTELSALLEKLDSARGRLERQAKELATGRSAAISPLTYEITDASDVDQYYRRLIPDVAQEVGKFLSSIDGMSNLVGMTYDEVYEALLKFGRASFAPLRSIRIEDVIREKRSLKTPEARLDELRQDSVPFWNIEVARLNNVGADMEPIVVVGVENKSASVYTGHERQGELLTTTRDPHTLTVLHTRHGLPITALRQIDDYRRCYEAHLRKKISPVHIFDMGSPKRGRTTFALGEAFGFVRANAPANYFYEIPAEHATLSRRVELGRGLGEAVRAFTTVPENVDTVEKLVDAHIQRIGTAEARRTIDDYINREYSKSSDRQQLERELRELAREYRDSYL